MLISFILGVFAGVLVAAVNQINRINDYERKIKILKVKIWEMEHPEKIESFTNDCLNDSEINEHTPSIY